MEKPLAHTSQATLFNAVKERILKNKRIKESGGFIGVPTPFEKLRSYVPSWERGHSIQVLGATGSGKSRLTRYLFLYQIYKFYKETGYLVKILLFPLEDGAEKVYYNIICHYLYEKHNVLISLQELNSKGDRVLPDFVEDYLNEAEEYFADFERIVHIIKGKHTPRDIYETCVNYARKTGYQEKYNVVVEGEEIEQKRYISDIHTFVIIDNMSNLEIDDECPTERDAMNILAKKYVREKLCNYYQFTVIQVLQADFSTERQQFTREGTSIVQKLEPSLASIGESKTICRAAHLVFGMFDPSRYDLMVYPIPPKTDLKACYNIEILGNRFRSLKLLKNNDGDFNFRVGMLFNGMNETFEELPQPKDERMEPIYARFRAKKKFVATNSEPVTMNDGEDDPF